jgi:hypothetical protein
VYATVPALVKTSGGSFAGPTVTCFVAVLLWLPSPSVTWNDTVRGAVDGPSEKFR